MEVAEQHERTGGVQAPSGEVCWRNGVVSRKLQHVDRASPHSRRVEVTMLTDRWKPLKRHEIQLALIQSQARFRVVPAGRRSGKTERAKRYLVREALRSVYGKFDDPRFFAAAPTRDQARTIYWDDLKRLVPRNMLAGTPSESNLSISLINGAEIRVVGMDKPERIEGSPWDGGILDEFANMKPRAWGENVRPALSDRTGWCWLIGVPEGRNHYYDLYKRALADDTGEWAAFTWPSADILPASEIQSARNDLDELTFQQEYEASFVNFQGRAYYPFNEATHVARLSHLYNPRATLIVMFDFNVEPGVAVIAQEMMLPNGVEGTGIIGEVYIKQNSNTPAVCRKIIQMYGTHVGRVVAYGDATGGSRGTAKVMGSDWALIKQELGAQFRDRFFLKVKKANPPERSRINAVNSRLKSQDGVIRMMVDGAHCQHVIKDFEGTALLAGGSGELDKKKTPDLTHMTDGIGYYVEYEFPTEKREVYETKLVGL